MSFLQFSDFESKFSIFGFPTNSCSCRHFRHYFTSTSRMLFSDCRPRDSICNALYWDIVSCHPLHSETPSFKTIVHYPSTSSNTNHVLFGEWVIKARQLITVRCVRTNKSFIRDSCILSRIRLNTSTSPDYLITRL